MLFELTNAPVEFTDFLHRVFQLYLDQFVVVFGSLQLKNHKRNYTTHDMELAAIVFALNIWCHYLYNEQFKGFLDHKSLKYIFTQHDLNTRQRRWMEYLEDYEFTLHYHHGKADVVDNAFSQKSRGVLVNVSSCEWQMPKIIGQLGQHYRGQAEDALGSLVAMPSLLSRVIES